jgi:hypothetical protein
MGYINLMVRSKKHKKFKFKINDCVEVIDRGMHYPNYSRMATRLGINPHNGVGAGGETYNSRIREKTGVVIGMARHDSFENENVIAVRDSQGNTFLIGERGLIFLDNNFFDKEEFQIG